MNDILCRQLALDYCCSEEDVRDDKDHFMIYRPLEGRRRFHNDDECFLKIAVINNKVLYAGKEQIIEWCREHYKIPGGEWFFEADNLRPLNDKLHSEGKKIKFVHPFYISSVRSEVSTDGLDIKWYENGELERFSGDDRFGEALAFCEEAPDMIAVTANSGGRIIGMAGASCDSPTMWQIGINVDNCARGSGIGKTLVALLKNEVLERGKLPFYGTSMSHIASQRVALGAGFLPAWAELAVSEL